MGLSKYTITVESDAPPQLFLGAIIGGATVVEMRQEKEPSHKSPHSHSS